MSNRLLRVFALLLIGALGLSCLLILSRMMVQGVPGSQTQAVNANPPEPASLMIPYTCREQHGFLFLTDQPFPNQPSLDQTSVASQELDFSLSLMPSEERFELQYTFDMHLVDPLPQFRPDGTLEAVQYNDRYVAKKGAGNGDLRENWLTGSLWDVTSITLVVESKDFESTQYFNLLGVVQPQSPPQVLLCAWKDPLDLAAAREVGAAGFAQFCQDYLYFVCDLK